MTGTIVEIDLGYQRGKIRAEDGALHPFERDGMVRWLDFLDLKAGDRVTFDVEGNDAVNVEPVERQR